MFTVGGDELTATDDPSKVMIRQMTATFAQFGKSRRVGMLTAARRRNREVTGKCEGRRSHAGLDPDLVAMLKRLRRKKPKKGGHMTRQAVSAELAAKG